MTSRDVALNHLDAWASTWWHRRFGGLGYPRLEDCLTVLPDADRALAAVCDKSSAVYETTSDKYVLRGRGLGGDRRTQACVLVVDRLLTDLGRPRLLVGLLLHLYPQRGRFAPLDSKRAEGIRGFRPTEWVEGSCGRLASGYLDRSMDRFLEQVHNEFLRELTRTLRG